MKVWKFVLKPEQIQEVAMPIGAEIVHVAEQHDYICLWALVEETAKTEARMFALIGTGDSVPNFGYIGTALMDSGTYVFHVFERQSRPASGAPIERTSESGP